MTNVFPSHESANVIPLSVLRAVADPRILRLIVLPTEQCNFRCTYCYEDFKIGRMKAGIVNALKQWILSRVDDVDEITISWFGGEPTLALPVVLDVSTTARSSFQKNNKIFSGGMTTNGYLLTKKNFTSLLSAGVTHFQISLDGPEAIHNQTRVLANGKPTFSILWDNLKNIALLSSVIDTPFHVDLRIHYDGTSAKQLRPLVDQIKAELMPTNRFSVQFHEIEKLGGPGDDKITLEK